MKTIDAELCAEHRGAEHQGADFPKVLEYLEYLSEEIYDAVGMMLTNAKHSDCSHCKAAFEVKAAKLLVGLTGFSRVLWGNARSFMPNPPEAHSIVPQAH